VVRGPDLRLEGSTGYRPRAPAGVRVEELDGSWLTLDVDALEAGGGPLDVEKQRPFAVLRDGRLLRLDEDGALPLRTGDLVVSVAAGGEGQEG